MKREDAVAAGVRKVRNARPWTKERLAGLRGRVIAWNKWRRGREISPPESPVEFGRLLDELADILGILAGEDKRKGQTGNAD